MNTKHPKMFQSSHRYNPSWTLAQSGGRALLTCLIISLGLAGCGSKDPAVPNATTQTPAAKSGDWFCQPAAPGAQEPWECVQDKNLAANPRPDRLPNAKEDNWAPSSGSQLESNPSTTRPQPDDSQNPVPENPVPPLPPRVEEDQTDDEAPIKSNDPPATASTSSGSDSPTLSTTPTNNINPRTNQSTSSSHQQRQAPDYIRLAYQPTTPISILELPTNFYAVQLAALNSAAKVQKFITKHQLTKLTAAKVAIGNKVRYVLILGIYDSREKAEVAAADRLPGPLASFTPWIRKLGNLQDAMRNANAQGKT